MADSARFIQWSEIWNVSLRGLRQNFLPGILLSFFGLIVVLLYYGLEEASPFFNALMTLRDGGGFLYSAVATAIFGGVIPYLFLLLSGRIPQGSACSWAAFFVIYWTTRGVEVDAFYRLQAWLFGQQTDWQTIAIKVMVDQFVYCPFWSAPITAICYGWKDVGFSWSKLKPRLGKQLFLFDVPSVLLSIWIVWIPATAIIYSLPLALQIPLFNLVLCFFVLLVSMLNEVTLSKTRFRSHVDHNKPPPDHCEQRVDHD